MVPLSPPNYSGEESFEKLFADLQKQQNIQTGILKSVVSLFKV